MLAPATRRGATSRPAAKSPEQIAREMIAQLKVWAAECPDYRRALRDCAEDVAWTARLKPCEAETPSVTAGLKHGACQIVTTLMLWAELRPQFERSLRSCVEEIELLGERQELNGKANKMRGKARAREAVLLSFETAELQTSREIADATGFLPRRVRRALVRLQQLGLVRDAGCAAQTHADGYRARLYALVHTRP